MPPKKVGQCPVLLPHLGGKVCTVGGQCLFGTTAPALVSHALVVTLGCAAYFWHTGDTHYAGLGVGLLNQHPFNMPLSYLPADWHWWLCHIMMVDALLNLFPTPICKFWSRLYGVCPSSVQLAAAVFLPCVGAFYLKPFEGYAFLCFGFGYATAMFFTMKAMSKLKWFSIVFCVVVLKLCAFTASANGTISNFHNAVYIAFWLIGAIAFSSMGPAHNMKPKRGRSASAKRK
jgi:hypothetical protein